MVTALSKKLSVRCRPRLPIIGGVMVTVGPWLGGGSDQSRYNECTKKYCHETELDAIMEAERLTGSIGRRFIVYHCVWCNGWHVGSK